jgi:hypothetical protein
MSGWRLLNRGTCQLKTKKHAIGTRMEDPDKRVERRLERV